MKAAKPTVDVEAMRQRINALQTQADKSKQLADSNIHIVKKKNKGTVLHTQCMIHYGAYSTGFGLEPRLIVDLRLKILSYSK